MVGMSGPNDASPLFAPVVASNGGATLVVPGVTSFAGRSWKIRVFALNVICNAAVNVKWQSNASDLTGLAYLAANCGYILPYNPIGWFETAYGEDLNINLSTGQPVGGHITYVLA